MDTLTDPTFITAAIAALAAVASAWISWHGFRRQAEATADPPVINVTCSRAAQVVTLGIELQNQGTVRWRATTLKIAQPDGARVITQAEITRRFPNARPDLSSIDGLTNVCSVNAQVGPVGTEGRFDSDRHWAWTSVLVRQPEAITLSMRLTLESMEPRPRCKVIAIKRQLPAAASIET